MERFAWKGRIKPGMAEEYKRRHDNIWPEMKELLKQAGLLEPVMASLAGTLLFHEPLSAATLAGIACVLAGVSILR